MKPKYCKAFLCVCYFLSLHLFHLFVCPDTCLCIHCWVIVAQHCTLHVAEFSSSLITVNDESILVVIYFLFSLKQLIDNVNSIL